MVGAQLRRLPETGYRLFRPVQHPQNHTGVVMRLRIGGSQGKRFLIMPQCVTQLTSGLENEAQFVMRFREIRLEPERLAETLDGIVRFSLPVQRDAEIEMREWDVGADGEHAAAAGFRLIEGAKLAIDGAQQEPGLGIVAGRLTKLRTNSFGLRPLPRLDQCAYLLLVSHGSLLPHNSRRTNRSGGTGLFIHLWQQRYIFLAKLEQGLREPVIGERFFIVIPDHLCEQGKAVFQRQGERRGGKETSQK